MPVTGEGEQLAPPGHEAHSGLINTNHHLRTALLHQLAAHVRTIDPEGRAPDRRVTVRPSVGVGVEHGRDTNRSPAPRRPHVAELDRGRSTPAPSTP